MNDSHIRIASKDGSPNVTDEKVNTCTHLAGAILALTGTVLLIVYSSIAGKPWHIVSFSIYGFSLFALFLASTFHHGINGSTKTEHLLKSLDYSAIFLLIAGSFTPMCLTIVRGPLGWSIFGVVWVVAVTGMALKACWPQTPKWITNTLFLTMGWLGLILAGPIYKALGWDGLALLVLGGTAYSMGSVIFAVEKPNPIPGKLGFHEIWHIFVIVGSLAHFCLMYFFILPA